MGPYPELHYNAARAAYESREYGKAESYIMQALSTEDTEFQQTEEYGLAFELAASIKDGLEQQRQERVRQLEKQREDEQLEAQRLAAEQRQSMALQQAMQPYDLEQRRVQLEQFLVQYPGNREAEDALEETKIQLKQQHLSRVLNISDLRQRKKELGNFLKEYPDDSEGTAAMRKTSDVISKETCIENCNSANSICMNSTKDQEYYDCEEREEKRLWSEWSKVYDHCANEEWSLFKFNGVKQYCYGKYGHLEDEIRQKMIIAKENCQRKALARIPSICEKKMNQCSTECAANPKDLPRFYFESRP